MQRVAGVFEKTAVYQRDVGSLKRAQHDGHFVYRHSAWKVHTCVVYTYYCFICRARGGHTLFPGGNCRSRGRRRWGHAVACPPSGQARLSAAERVSRRRPMAANAAPTPPRPARPAQSLTRRRRPVFPVDVDTRGGGRTTRR